MAPELLRGEHNTKASDVYAFGILLSEMLTRKLPYAGMDLAQVLKRIASCDEAELVRPALPLRLPAGMHALVISCWQDDAAARLSMSQVALQIAAMDIQSLSINLFARRADAKNQARVLNDVFPPHVADILKRGEKVRPEHRPEVTLFFSDIVGFTDISAQLTPAKVSDMLDRLYTAFDGLVDKYDLFKVETIGDAYFCASNLVKDQPQHTELMARFAMDAIDAASNTLVDLDLPRLGCIKIRAGSSEVRVGNRKVPSREGLKEKEQDKSIAHGRGQNKNVISQYVCNDESTMLSIAEIEVEHVLRALMSSCRFSFTQAKPILPNRSLFLSLSFFSRYPHRIGSHERGRYEESAVLSLW